MLSSFAVFAILYIISIRNITICQSCHRISSSVMQPYTVECIRNVPNDRCLACGSYSGPRWKQDTGLLETVVQAARGVSEGALTVARFLSGMRSCAGQGGMGGPSHEALTETQARALIREVHGGKQVCGSCGEDWYRAWCGEINQEPYAEVRMKEVCVKCGCDWSFRNRAYWIIPAFINRILVILFYSSLFVLIIWLCLKSVAMLTTSS